MAKRSIQKDLAAWKQVVGQAKDAIHPKEKLISIISSAGLPKSKTYIDYYRNSGILEYIGTNKMKISNEFKTTGNREERIKLFYMFVEEQTQKAKDKKKESTESIQKEHELQEQHKIQELKNDMIIAKEKIDSISLCLLDEIVECQELEDLNKSISELESILGNLVYNGENAEKMIQGLKLIASAI